MGFSPNSPQREVTRGLTAVPTSLTTITGTDTALFQIVVTNTTAAAITFQLQDQQGTPVALIKSTNVTIDPGIPFVFSVANAVWMLGGMRWQAGGAGLYADIIATYKG